MRWAISSLKLAAALAKGADKKARRDRRTRKARQMKAGVRLTKVGRKGMAARFWLAITHCTFEFCLNQILYDWTERKALF